MNKITILIRGKVAQEDILQEYRLGGMITKYIYGEIHADFLDEDDKDDIATSSRQKFLEDDYRYVALKKFIEKELKKIWVKTNILKENKSLDNALSSNPYIKQWFEELRPKDLRNSAKRIFTVIDQAGVDEAHKNRLYADSILAFEMLKMDNALGMLDVVDVNNYESFIDYLTDLDRIEESRYGEIIRERLKVIRRLKHKVEDDVKERMIQEYVFDHLWLLDPAWERATEYAYMEERLQPVLEGLSEPRGSLRIDIRYRRVAQQHVVVELKRASRSLNKTDIESQLRRYMDALEQKLQTNQDEARFPIDGICIVGKLPKGWDDPETRRRDEESLRPYNIRVLTYDKLIDNAFSAYGKYIEASGPVGDVRKLIEKIRSYEAED